MLIFQGVSILTTFASPSMVLDYQGDTIQARASGEPRR